MTFNSTECNDDSGSHDSALTFGGLLAACVGQFFVASGLLFINRSGRDDEPRWCFYKTLGIGLIMANAAGLDTLCYALAPLALSAPLTLLVLVFNQIMVRTGCIVAKQPISNGATFATGVIIVGMFLSTIFGPMCNSTPTINQMRGYIFRPAFLYYAVTCIVLILSCVLPRLLLRKPKHVIVKALWYGVGATLCGSLSNLGLKCVSLAIRVSIEGDMQFGEITYAPPHTPDQQPTRPACMRPSALTTSFASSSRRHRTWAFLLVTIVVALTNVALMNACVSAAPPAYGIPVYQSMLVLATIVAGGLFYDEFSQLTTLGKRAGFWGGVGLTLGGVILLARFTAPTVDGGAAGAQACPDPYGPGGADEPMLRASHASHASHASRASMSEAFRRTPTGAVIDALSSKPSSRVPSRMPTSLSESTE